jgi:signal transduction histidine kinase
MAVRRPPGGLRLRLAITVAAVLIASAGLTFLVVYGDTGRQLRAQIDSDLRSDNTQLVHTLTMLGGESRPAIAAAANSYVQGQPYGTISSLLFVLIDGVPPVSNHPELFGSVLPEAGESAAQQARENALGAKLLQVRAGYSTRQAPDVGNIRVFERRLRVSGLGVVAATAEPLNTVEGAQHSVARAFLLAGALSLALALLAGYLVGARLTAPLRRMARVAARVDAGDLGPRIEEQPGRGDEVTVLADAFNNMLDRLAGAFAAQREFVADASHELRTPLTVIRGQIEVLAAQGSPSGEEVRRVAGLVESEIGRITRLVDDMLVLAQSERRDFAHKDTFSLREFVTELWDGVVLTADRRFELGAVADGTLRADPDRLAQALRNLLRNAVEHTAAGSGLVQLEVLQIGPDRVRFAVTDDGPGIPAGERERIFERFHRTDPARSRGTGGAGLGLAIVRAVVEAHDGSVRAAHAASGGARFELDLPGFAAIRLLA